MPNIDQMLNQMQQSRPERPLRAKAKRKKNPAPEEMAAELNEVQKAFKERNKNEQVRFEDATDSEYWVCICFQNRQQKEQWLDAQGLLELGDKYINGVQAAEKAGIPMDIPRVPKTKIDATWQF